MRVRDLKEKISAEANTPESSIRLMLKGKPLIGIYFNCFVSCTNEYSLRNRLRLKYSKRLFDRK